jgi:hypothetical protein
VRSTRASNDGGRDAVPVILRGPLRGHLRMTDRAPVVLAVTTHCENHTTQTTFGIEFSLCGTQRLRFALAGAMPSVSVLRTAVSISEISARQKRLPRQ